MFPSPPQSTAVGLWLNLLHIELVIVRAVTADPAASGNIAAAAIGRLVSIAAGTRSRFQGAPSFAALYHRAATVHDAAVALAAAPSPEAFDAVVASFEKLVEAGNAIVMPAGAPAGVSIIGS